MNDILILHSILKCGSIMLNIYYPETSGLAARKLKD